MEVIGEEQQNNNAPLYQYGGNGTSNSVCSYIVCHAIIVFMR